MMSDDSDHIIVPETYFFPSGGAQTTLNVLLQSNPEGLSYTASPEGEFAIFMILFQSADPSTLR
jgi:hypothetical protein